MGKALGIPHPVEVILHHEIMGHIVPVLQNPQLLQRLLREKALWDVLERNAVETENRYRRRLGLPEMPPETPHSLGTDSR